MKKRSIRWTAAMAVFGSMLAMAPNSPVQADSVYFLVDKPTVTVADPGNFTPGSASYDEVVATIGLNGTVADLSTVVLCIYKTSGAGGLDAFDTTGSIDTVRHTCTGADENRIKLTWTEDGNAPTYGDFAIAGGTIAGEFANPSDVSTVTTGGFTGEGGAYVAGTYSGSAQALRITFKFKPGGAMLAGNNWVVSVAAAYPDDVCQKDGLMLDCTRYTGFDADDLIGSGAVTGKTASYYQLVQTGKSRVRGTTGLSYGFIKQGTTSPEINSPAIGEEGSIAYISNDYSTVTLRGTDFQRWDPQANEGDGGFVSGDSLTLKAIAGAPGVGEVALDCRDFSRTDDLATEGIDESTLLLRVARVESVVDSQAEDDGGTDLLHRRDATGSTPATARVTCTLSYGSGATVALAEYANTVTVGLKRWTEAP